jgi:DNA-binding MarR family transcriptional regulator
MVHETISEEAIMKADDCIFFQLAKASQAGARFWSQKVSGLSLTAVQAMIIRFLFDNDRIASSDLGMRVSLDSATLTGILDRLESAKLVERQQNPNDRRAIQIHLTEKGRTTGQEVARVMEKANSEFLSILNKDEEKELRCLLNKVRHRSGQ